MFNLFNPFKVNDFSSIEFSLLWEFLPSETNTRKDVYSILPGILQLSMIFYPSENMSKPNPQKWSLIDRLKHTTTGSVLVGEVLFVQLKRISHVRHVRGYSKNYRLMKRRLIRIFNRRGIFLQLPSDLNRLN